MVFVILCDLTQGSLGQGWWQSPRGVHRMCQSLLGPLSSHLHTCQQLFYLLPHQFQNTLFRKCEKHHVCFQTENKVLWANFNFVFPVG